MTVPVVGADAAAATEFKALKFGKEPLVIDLGLTGYANPGGSTGKIAAAVQTGIKIDLALDSA